MYYGARLSWYCWVGAFAISCPLLLAAADESGVPPEKSVSKEAVAAPADKRDEPSHRLIYFCKNANAGNLVPLLEMHFDGESGAKFVSEPIANVLSIRASSPAVLDEVLKTIARLDRPLRQIAITVMLVDFAPPKVKPAPGELPKLPVDVSALTGSAVEVTRQLGVWAAEGHVTSVRRFEMKALDNQQAQLHLGEMRPIPSGFTSNARTGVSTPTLTVRDFGLTIDMMPRIKEAENIDIFFFVQDSHPEPADRGVQMAAGESGPIVSPAIATRRVQSTISVVNGGTNVVGGFEAGPNSGHVPSAIVISARIVEAGAVPLAATEGPPRAATEGPQVSRRRTDTASNGLETLPSRNESSNTSTDRRREFGPMSLLAAARRDEIATRLKLSDEQREQFNSLRAEMLTAFRTSANRDELPAISQQFAKKAVDLLTNEQKKIWNDYEAEMLKKREAP